ncbi:MAG: hypothetical protein R3F61_13380 [Myxococcota bacterium]
MSILALWTVPAFACDAWGPVTALRELDHPNLDESSGLAASRQTPGALWTHDDSGDAVLFRFSLDGTVTEHPFPSADNKDWEDLAIAPCEGRGDCLYVGDIGAERGTPGEITVYVGREPDGDGPIVLKDRWELTWPGTPRDGETLLVSPCTLDAWIVTRGATTEVFRIPAGRGRKPLPLEAVATLQVDEPITSGDFSPDGTALVLRSDRTIWRYPFDPAAPDAHWSTAPERLFDLVQPGEAIAWDVDGDLLFTDEGRPTPVGRIACEDPVVPEVCAGPTGCGCATGRMGALPRSSAVLALSPCLWWVRRRRGFPPRAA